MKMRMFFLAIVCCALSATASAATTCGVVIVKSTMTLQDDCNTETPIIIPDGVTFNLNGFSITANDPASDHFRGGVVQNGGSRANVTNGTIKAAGLSEVCD